MTPSPVSHFGESKNQEDKGQYLPLTFTYDVLALQGAVCGKAARTDL